MSTGIEVCLKVSSFPFEVFRKTNYVPLPKQEFGDTIMKLLSEKQ